MILKANMLQMCCFSQHWGSACALDHEACPSRNNLYMAALHEMALDHTIMLTKYLNNNISSA